jgi:ferric-dicitrate binding protein FerR (iron transport regulator)
MLGWSDEVHTEGLGLADYGTDPAAPAFLRIDDGLQLRLNAAGTVRVKNIPMCRGKSPQN